MASENIDIKVSEDGSRTAARNIDDMGKSAEKSASSVDKLGNALNGTRTWQEKLKAAGSAAIDVAKSMGILQGAATLLRGAIIALASAFASFVVAGLFLVAKWLVEGWTQSNSLRKELLALGGVAGTSTTAFEQMAAGVGSATGRVIDARKAVVGLAETGKVSFDQLKNLGQGVVNLSVLTGKSVEEMTGKIAGLGDNTSKTILQLNADYGLFTTAIYDQVRALEDQGKTQEAANLAAKALADDTKIRAEESVHQMGFIEVAVDALRGKYEEFKNWVLSLGRDKTMIEQLSEAKDKAEELKKVMEGNDAWPARLTGAYARAVKDYNDQLAKTADLQKRVDADANKSAQVARDAAANKAALQADARIQDRLESLGKVNRLQKEINKNVADYNMLWEQQQRTGKPIKALEGVTRDAQGRFSGGSYDTTVAGIVERFSPRGGRGRTGVDHSAEREAEKRQRELEALANAVDRYAGRSSSAAHATQELAKAQAVFAKGVKEGMLTQAEANTYLAGMAQRLKDQLDPLAAVNRHMDENEKLLNMSAEARDAYNAQLSITQGLQRQGKTLNDDELKHLQARIVAEQELTRIAQIRDGLERNSSAGRAKDADRKLDAITGLRQSSGGSYSKNDAFSDATQGMQGLFKGTSEAIEANKAAYADMYAYIGKLQKDNIISEQTASVVKRRIWAQESQDQFEQTNKALTGVAALMNTHSKKAFEAGKAAAVAQAMIQTYLAAQAAAASTATIPFVGWAMWPIEMAAAIASGLANVSAIRSQQMPAYRTGGSWTVGGAGGVDSQTVAFRATPGEQININTPAQARAIERMGIEQARPQPSRPVTQNITMVVQGRPDRRTDAQLARGQRRAAQKEFERSK